jgi:hypothetical protein
MGLTVSYSIETNNRRRDLARKKIERMHSIALDLGFEHVGDIVEFEGYTSEKDHHEKPTIPDDHRWTLIQAGQHVDIPWTLRDNGNGHKLGASMFIEPDWFCGFSAWPGEGSESLEIVLSEMPRTFQAGYKPEDDAKFKVKDRHQFDREKWERWCKRTGKDEYLADRGGWYCPYKAYETRTVKIPGSAKMHASGFCKTQYASQFGMPHFVRCHLSVCHLLKRIGEIPGVTVDINDEGHYEASTYSDDWREAREAGREPTYVWHPPTYSVATLIRECGDYNELVAGMAGAIKDAIGGTGVDQQAPIMQYANFEHLEAACGEGQDVRPVLEALKSIPLLEVEEN